MLRVGAPGRPDDAAFRTRVARFEADSRKLRTLCEALRAQATTNAAAREAARNIAKSLKGFDGARAVRPGQDPFLAVAKAIADADVTASRADSKYRTEVLGSVEALVDQLPEVRHSINNRRKEYGSLQRWERKVARESSGNGRPGKRQEFERLCREAKARFDHAHADASNRMNLIHQKLPMFLLTPLSMFIEVETERLREQEAAYLSTAKQHTQNVYRRISKSSASRARDGVSYEDSMSVSIERNVSTIDGRALTAPLPLPSIEVWDDADFGESELAGQSRGSGFSSNDRGLQGSASEPLYLADTTDSLEMPPSPSDPVGIDSHDLGSFDTHLADGASVSSGASEHHSHRRKAGGSASTSSSLSGVTVKTASTAKGANSSNHHRKRRPRASDSALSRGSRDATPVLHRMKALFDYNPEEVNEIRLSRGDVVEVQQKHASGWWHGRVRGGEAGYFPAAYCKQMTQEEELEYITSGNSAKGSRSHRGHGSVRDSGALVNDDASESVQQRPNRIEELKNQFDSAHEKGS